MKKQAAALILALAMCLSLLPAMALAADSGFELQQDVLEKYTGDGGAVVIPDGVSLISFDAFRDRTDITSVVMPKSVRWIWDDAFRGCTSLREITFSPNLEDIGKGAFADTAWVKAQGDFAVVNGILIAYQGSGGEVAVPSGVKHINGDVFQGNTKLTSVVIPDGAASIDGLAFMGCSSLSKVTVPSSVTEIGVGAFSRTPWIENNFGDYVIVNHLLLSYRGTESSVILPQTVDTVCAGAFSNAPNLTSVTIPSGVTRLDFMALDAPNLKSVFLSSSASHLASTLFLDDSKVTDIYYGGSQNQWNALRDMDFQAKIDIPAGAVVHYGSEIPKAPLFADVASSAYYNDAVAWAVEKKITNGTNSYLFSPNATCSNAQIITFLWRANGAPKPASASPFTDVPEGSYYSEAAAWAAEKGIAGGTAFQPNAPCTRAATMEYMWKAAGSPKPEKAASFTDVSAGASYAQAVSWAVEQGITSGTSAVTFGPGSTCTRGQIVTFLYRAMGKETASR